MREVLLHYVVSFLGKNPEEDVMFTVRGFVVAVMLVLASMVNASAATTWSAEKSEYTLGEVGNIVVTVDASDFPTGLPSMGITLVMSGVTMELGQMEMSVLTSLQGAKIAYQFNLTEETSQVTFTHPYTGVKLFTSGFNVKQGTNGKLQVTNLGASDEYSSTGLRLRHIIADETGASGLTKVSEGYYTAKVGETIYIWAILEDRDGNVVSGKKVVMSGSTLYGVADHKMSTTPADPHGFSWSGSVSGPIVGTYCVYLVEDPTVKPLIIRVQFQQ